MMDCCLLLSLLCCIGLLYRIAFLQDLHYM
jgi:hypothetical protein